MNDRWLNSFLCVARCGSVNKAAEQLYISPQALLQQLNLLEADVGVRLLNRARSGVALTLAGREFLAGAKNILDTYHTTLNRCRLVDRAETTIRIPMFAGLVVPAFVEQVCERYIAENPNHFNIQYLSCQTLPEEQLSGLLNLEYDIIQHFCLNGYHSKNIHFEKFLLIRTWCIMAPGHPLAGKNPITPEDLNHCTVGTNALHLMRQLQIYTENTGLLTQFVRIRAERYAILEACSSGFVALMNEDVARTFPLLYSAPLDFDMRTFIGFACRTEMYEFYEPFFAAARQVRKEMFPELEEQAEQTAGKDKEE